MKKTPLGFHTENYVTSIYEGKNMLDSPPPQKKKKKPKKIIFKKKKKCKKKKKIKKFKKKKKNKTMEKLWYFGQKLYMVLNLNLDMELWSFCYRLWEYI